MGKDKLNTWVYLNEKFVQDELLGYSLSVVSAAAWPRLNVSVDSVNI